MYRHFFKRLIDILLSFIALVVLSPVFLAIAVLVRSKLGSPIIFKQPRPGKDEKIFTMYKFRTMTNERDEHGELLPDSIRLTNIGKFLRSTSLDELPELINILKGDMSFVGPRPLSVKYLPYYNDRERLRHSVRPGLTGLAQINGRNTLNWEDRFKYDVNYVENLSFILDMSIMIRTFIKVFKREGITVRGTTEIISFHVYRQGQLEKERN